jgi:hypothetical protein
MHAMVGGSERGQGHSQHGDTRTSTLGGATKRAGMQVTCRHTVLSTLTSSAHHQDGAHAHRTARTAASMIITATSSTSISSNERHHVLARSKPVLVQRPPPMH